MDRDGDRRWRIALLNGLNMTNLGRRDRHIYGTIESLTALEDLIAETGSRIGVDVEAFHSNDEGALVDFVEERDDFDGFLVHLTGETGRGQEFTPAQLRTFAEGLLAQLAADEEAACYLDDARPPASRPERCTALSGTN